MTDRKLNILASPGFVISLLLLLLNDFVFKTQFHNQLTGKLSDFDRLRDTSVTMSAKVTSIWGWRREPSRKPSERKPSERSRH
jgi:hypothetical protein